MNILCVATSVHPKKASSWVLFRNTKYSALRKECFYAHKAIYFLSFLSQTLDFLCLAMNKCCCFNSSITNLYAHSFTLWPCLSYF